MFNHASLKKLPGFKKQVLIIKKLYTDLHTEISAGHINFLSQQNTIQLISSNILYTFFNKYINIYLNMYLIYKEVEEAPHKGC